MTHLRRVPRLTAVTVSVASLMALTVACGGGSSEPSYTIPTDADLVVKAVPTIRWDSEEYTAPAGEIDVFLANDDNVKHILVILKDDKVFGDLELVVDKQGDFDRGTITLESGEYRIYCTIPGHSSMDSLLTVS
jgi:plastocyanin